MITDDRSGVGGTGFNCDGDTGTTSADGVKGNTPMLLSFSSRRISLVASIPLMTGS